MIFLSAIFLLKKLFQSNTPLLCNRDRIAQFCQCIDCCFDYVVRVRRSLRFCEHILYTTQFKYGSHRTSGNYTGSFSSWFDHYSSPAKLSFLCMWNCSFQQWEFDHILLSVFDRFGNTLRHITRLTKTISYRTISITNDHQRSEERRVGKECKTQREPAR